MSLDLNSLKSIARTTLNHQSGRSAMFKFGAVTTVDINSEKVFEEIAFGIARRFNISASGDYWIILDTTGVSLEKEIVVLPIGITGFGAGPIHIDFHRNVVFSGGTEVTAINRYHASTNTAETVFTQGVTVSDEGIASHTQWLLPSDGVPATSILGGQAKDDLIFVPDKNYNYGLKFTNTEADIAQCSISLTFFEATLEV